MVPPLLEPQVLEFSLRSITSHSNESTVTTGSSGTMTGSTLVLEYDPDATEDENEAPTIEKTVPTSDLSRLSESPNPVRQHKVRRGQGIYVVTIDDTASSNLPEQRFTRHKTAPSWADPKSNDWDCVKFLQSEYALVEDPLLRLPDPNHSYIDRNGRLKDPNKYARYVPKQPKQYLHPKLAQHLKTRTDTFLNRRYYQDRHSIPIAGIRRGAGKDTKGNPMPDDFGPYEEEPDFDQYLDITYGDQCDFDFAYDIDSINANPNRAKQESDFQHKPMVKLIIPDYIKAILVDDWENVTKNQQLVPLPSEQPVNKILDNYFEEEVNKRDSLSAQKILEEVVAGLKEYFDKCLGRILLYRSVFMLFVSGR